MTDLDRQAIQRCRAWIGPDRRLLTDDDIRAMGTYRDVLVGMELAEFFWADMAHATEALKAFHAAFELAARLTPPEDQ